jgi:signal transduction histidine kinase
LRAAERTSSSRLSVSAVGVGRYQRHVEETAYFCVLEAVERSRMAGATTVDVSVADVAGELIIEIDCAGQLGDADLTAVSDRVDAFDGTTTVDTLADGSTRVSCRLPVGDQAMESA